MEQTEKEKKDQVRNMFNRIAHRYDLLNHVLSFGIDYGWRKKTIRMLKEDKAKNVLDMATGTGDLAIMAAKAGIEHIQGVDISSGMLHKGKEKIHKKNLEDKIKFDIGDSEDLPFEDNVYDAAMVAFGVRNYANLKKGLAETNRVLKPNGLFLVLEFSKPEKFPIKQLYNFYSFSILPLIGRIISNDKSAYTYLPESVSKFPYGDEFIGRLEEVGFQETGYKVLSGGIATLYYARKARN